jgi:hypothetical protein
MLERGDDQGKLAWARMKRVIEALQAQTNGRLN